MLKDVQYNPKLNFNLFSIGKAIKEDWKLSGDQKGVVLTKDSAKLVFDIKIMIKNGGIFCMQLWKEHEVSAILAITSVTVSIEKTHIMTRHHNEEQTQKILMELGWSLKNKKATRAGKRMFSDLVTIKAPQDSGITIIHKKWHIVVDQYTEYKELEFYCNKSVFVEPTCKKFSK